MRPRGAGLNVRRGGIPRKLRDRVNGRVILQHYQSECFLYLLIHNFRLYLHAELDKAFHLAIKIALLPAMHNSFHLCSISRYDRCGFRYLIRLRTATDCSIAPIFDSMVMPPIPGSETETEHPFRGFRSVDHMPVTGQIDRRRYKLCASRKAPFAVNESDFLIGHKK
jgi:hypothetical protein